MNQTLDFALEDESDLYFYQMMHRMNWLEAEKLDAQAGKNRTAEQSKSYARLLHWLNVQNNRNRRKQWLAGTARVLQRAAVFVLLFVFAAGCTAIQVDAFREQLGNWLLNWRPDHLAVMSPVDPYEDRTPYAMDQLSFAFGWLPDGCYLIDRSMTDEEGNTEKFLFDVWREDMFVGQISLMSRTVQMSLDDQDAQLEYPDLQGYQQAIYLEKTYTLSNQLMNYRCLVAQNDWCVVYASNENVEDGLSKDQLVQILEQIRFLND